ncbi:MAG: hypothetical protein A2Y57_04015 [Candidatus Woykebacteria bacterium RBG_13_40_7b]|uniref:Type II secretion system protein GspG C-terminal domain-containing protein n=1 Tax=Candidatus Woykebacteria bacterium RBG_13_40_7b TaxID=1802594 RepID=A0A1G1W7I6_9BACT|nr:MAG: hypothetical protein A2Y57_04015 [Candidatus Woykebacteria bacterium RBG_13_40_7b]
MTFNKLQKGFTILELVIIVGILCFVGVAILPTLNLPEKFKERRDSQRIKDLNNLKEAVDKALSDEKLLSGTRAFPFSGNSSGSNLIFDADRNWTGVELEGYIGWLPTDPSQGKIKGEIINGNGEKLELSKVTLSLPDGCKKAFSYCFVSDGTNYQIGAFLEAAKNFPLIQEIYNPNESIMYSVGNTNELF